MTPCTLQYPVTPKVKAAVSAQEALPPLFVENKAILFAAMHEEGLCTISVAFNLGHSSLDNDYVLARRTPGGDEFVVKAMVTLLHQTPSGMVVTYPDALLWGAENFAASLFDYLAGKYELPVAIDDADFHVDFIIDSDDCCRIEAELLAFPDSDEKKAIFDEAIGEPVLMPTEN